MYICIQTVCVCSTHTYILETSYRQTDRHTDRQTHRQTDTDAGTRRRVHGVRPPPLFSRPLSLALHASASSITKQPRGQPTWAARARACASLPVRLCASAYVPVPLFASVPVCQCACVHVRRAAWIRTRTRGFWPLRSSLRPMTRSA
jgi:hypothetical protein